MKVGTVTRTFAGAVPVYDGPYEAIPKVEAQTLPTAKKKADDGRCDRPRRSVL